MRSPKYANGFDVTIHPDELERPDHWRRPRRIFVCSMGDLFHEDVLDGFIEDVLGVASRNPQHVFQVLTKRAVRLSEFGMTRRFPANVWIGVSVENDAAVDRVHEFEYLDARVRFVSCEPLLEPLPSLLPLIRGLDWVIVGGETGPGGRCMPVHAVLPILETCREVGVPFFFKRWGSYYGGEDSRQLLGREWNEFPTCQAGSMKRGRANEYRLDVTESPRARALK
jgi:protein gp37